MRTDIYIHRGSRDAESSHIGRWVKFKDPSVAYKNPNTPIVVQNKKRGKVTRVMPNGKLEIRAATGGYHELSEHEVEFE